MTDKKPQDHLPKRKGFKKKAAPVTFTVDGFEGEFTLPELKLGFGDQKRLAGKRDSKGNLVATPDASVLTDYLEGNGAGEYVDLIDDMDDDEVGAFIEGWTGASGLDLGKSEPASS